MSERVRDLIRAVAEDDLERVRTLVADSEVRGGVNETLGPFDSPAIINVKSREMLDVLLAAGADINARSTWWAGGFGLLAGFHGNVGMAREILRFGPLLEAPDGDFKATPLGWTIYGSQNGWYVSSGRHAETIELLLRAGAKRPQEIGGSPAVREVLQRL